MTTTTSELRPRRSTSQRLVVPDILRGIAIIAMLVAHAAPFIPNVPLLVKLPVSQLNDLASPLFALVMGMSAQLVWDRGRTVRRTLLEQGIRAAILIVLGVWMAVWGSWVAVILAYLGVLLIVGVPILLLRTRTVLAIAAVVLLLSQPLVAATRSSVWLLSQPPVIRELAAWVLTGPSYRLVNLLPFFLVGAVLIRHGLRRDWLLWVFAVVAPIAYVTALVAERLLTIPTLSGDYSDTLHDVGLVFAVYVLVVLAASVQKEGAQRFWQVVFEPVRACGQVALSLYLLHVGLIAVWSNVHGRPAENVFAGWLVIVPGVILAGWLWWRFVGTGPVEWVMGLLTGRRKSLRRA